MKKLCIWLSLTSLIVGVSGLTAKAETKEYEFFSSTIIKSIIYNSETQTLTVKFGSGAITEFYKVPETVISRFISAPGKGGFYKGNLENRYSFKEIVTIEPPPEESEEKGKPAKATTPPKKNKNASAPKPKQPAKPKPANASQADDGTNTATEIVPLSTPKSDTPPEQDAGLAPDAPNL